MSTQKPSSSILFEILRSLHNPFVIIPVVTLEINDILIKQLEFFNLPTVQLARQKHQFDYLYDPLFVQIYDIVLNVIAL